MDDLRVQDLEGNEKQLLGFKHQSDMYISMFQNLVDGFKKEEIRERGAQVRRQPDRADKDDKNELKRQ